MIYKSVYTNVLGDELYTYLVKNGKLPLDETKKIFTQLCGAVAYTHSKSCTHRDLKLENILLDKRHNVKLVDFGFTREYESRNLLDTVCGTTCYMAPEMLLHKKYFGEAVDVWSLGVIFFTLLYGEMPFEEENDVETKMKIITEEPRYSNQQTIPEPALELLKSMLSKEPKNRSSLQSILHHPFLEEYASVQRDILSTREPRLFSTKAEKRVLRSLRSAHVDLDNLTESVLSVNCDSLAGFWSLALEREHRVESKRLKRGIARYSLSRKNSESRHDRKELRKLNITSVPQSPLNDSHPVSPLESKMINDNPNLNGTVSSGKTLTVKPQRQTILVKDNSSIQNSQSSTLRQSPSQRTSMSSILARTKRTFSLGNESKKKDSGNVFKNVIVKFLLAGSKKKESENPDSLKSVVSSIDSLPRKAEVSTGSPNSQTIPGFNNDNLDLRVGTRSFQTMKPRPVSQISQISQISQFSQFSVTSQISSTGSQISQDRIPSTSSYIKRPHFGRRSTSSSLSSLVSRHKHGKRHSKTSSTSSASLNSSPRGTRRVASPDNPLTGFGRSPAPFHRRQYSGPRTKFNEPAVFSSYTRSRSSKHRSPFARLGEASSSVHADGTKIVRKGSVIEEGDEEEKDMLNYEDDDTEDDRGRAY